MSASVRSQPSTASQPAHKSARSPKCALCGGVIADVVVQAMDTTWHQDHFQCAHCQRPITSPRYHVFDGKSYCEADYAALFLKRCDKCQQPIKDVVVMALGRPWHKEHFTCNSCSTLLSHKGFYEKEDKPYCSDCFEGKFCPVCHSCGRTIVDQAVVALGDKYHLTCFRCTRCDQAIRDGTFKILDKRPVCEKCYL
ncbi:paxillin-like [Macrosteles quadrilineatus]|uniref:paxillin-like n=1 Tax=Macrosteles quadrilineatus TaxID=74068 RepID=UPI0023E2EF9F|nr:paxillin-like [Macrosteles quadrilineatus]